MSKIVRLIMYKVDEKLRQDGRKAGMGLSSERMNRGRKFEKSMEGIMREEEKLGRQRYKVQ